MSAPVGSLAEHIRLFDCPACGQAVTGEFDIAVLSEPEPSFEPTPGVRDNTVDLTLTAKVRGIKVIHVCAPEEPRT